MSVKEKITSGSTKDESKRGRSGGLVRGRTRHRVLRLEDVNVLV